MWNLKLEGEVISSNLKRLLSMNDDVDRVLHACSENVDIMISIDRDDIIIVKKIHGSIARKSTQLMLCIIMSNNT
jgi:hypothetical protein